MHRGGDLGGKVGLRPAHTARLKLDIHFFSQVDDTPAEDHAPISLASYDVLLRTGNPLVRGTMPKDGTPEFTAALMGFVFVHCAPWPEVVRASFDDQRFKEEALIFCGEITPEDFQTAFQRLEEQSKQLEAAQVEPVSGVGGKKRSPATNPAS